MEPDDASLNIIQDILDVIIIGAGPCGLAVAARLHESTPSAIFTDEEHQRYHWIRKYGRRVNTQSKHLKPCRNCSHNVRNLPPQRNYRIIVLDSTADVWMAKWNYLFETFDIKHLRSPMFFHVDPLDRDGLLAHTYENHRECELQAIENCCGKEISKHKMKKKRKQRQSCQLGPRAVLEIDERDRKDYFNPSTSLFRNHCDCIIDRYELKKELLRKETVKDIDYGRVESVMGTVDNVFTIKTENTLFYSKTVVLAVGAGNAPSIPPAVETVSQSLEGVCHSMQIKIFPDESLQMKIKGLETTQIAIVGGGLTSAQIGDLALRCGVTKVWHFMRGTMKVKAFDVDLAWMGKFKNHEKAVFWSAENDEERLEQIKRARGGGSITPNFHKIMKQHSKEGTLSLHMNTTVRLTEYDKLKKKWYLETTPRVLDLPPMDYVYFATGIQVDFEKLEYLATMRKRFPIHGHGGMPCLNDDLMWSMDVPLFVTGRLSSLRLGPGAGNLEGARVGAERISWKIESLLERKRGADQPECEEDEYRFSAGIGSRFESLVRAD